MIDAKKMQGPSKVSDLVRVSKERKEVLESKFRITPWSDQEPGGTGLTSYLKLLFAAALPSMRDNTKVKENKCEWYKKKVPLLLQEELGKVFESSKFKDFVSGRSTAPLIAQLAKHSLYHAKKLGREHKLSAYQRALLEHTVMAGGLSLEMTQEELDDEQRIDTGVRLDKALCRLARETLLTQEIQNILKADKYKFTHAAQDYLENVIVSMMINFATSPLYRDACKACFPSHFDTTSNPTSSDAVSNPVGDIELGLKTVTNAGNTLLGIQAGIKPDEYDFAQRTHYEVMAQVQVLKTRVRAQEEEAELFMALENARSIDEIKKLIDANQEQIKRVEATRSGDGALDADVTGKIDIHVDDRELRFRKEFAHKLCDAKKKFEHILALSEELNTQLDQVDSKEVLLQCALENQQKLEALHHPISPSDECEQSGLDLLLIRKEVALREALGEQIKTAQRELTGAEQLLVQFDTDFAEADAARVAEMAIENQVALEKLAARTGTETPLELFLIQARTAQLEDISRKLASSQDGIKKIHAFVSTIIELKTATSNPMIQFSLSDLESKTSRLEEVANAAKAVKSIPKGVLPPKMLTTVATQLSELTLVDTQLDECKKVHWQRRGLKIIDKFITAKVKQLESVGFHPSRRKQKREYLTLLNAELKDLSAKQPYDSPAALVQTAHQAVYNATRHRDIFKGRHSEVAGLLNAFGLDVTSVDSACKISNPKQSEVLKSALTTGHAVQHQADKTELVGEMENVSRSRLKQLRVS